MHFLPLPPPSPDEVAHVLAGTARRIARLAASRAEDDDGALTRDEPLLATLAAASLRSRVAMGPVAGQRWRRLGDRVEPHGEEHDSEASPHIPQHGGMSLHADVAVPARDRRRLERLCRYVARPPLAHDRLEVTPDGRLALRLKTRWRDGTTHILMERHELLERLVPLIPPPRAHQVRYHGVLAPCASARDRVVLGPRPPWAAAEVQAPLPGEDHDPARMRPRAPKERCDTDEWRALRSQGRSPVAFPCARCTVRGDTGRSGSPTDSGRARGTRTDPCRGELPGPSSSSVSSRSMRFAAPRCWRADAPARCHRRPGGGPQDPRMPRTPRAWAAARSPDACVGRLRPRILARGVPLGLQSSARRGRLTNGSARTDPRRGAHIRPNGDPVTPPVHPHAVRRLARPRPSAAFIRAPAHSAR